MTTGVRSWNKGDDLNHATPLLVVARASMLGLNPVKLEQYYWALYNVYATHIGQGKEAAQVATKYMISDLWKGAVAQDVMLPPSLLDATVTVTTADHDVATLRSLVSHLSGWLESVF